MAAGLTAAAITAVPLSARAATSSTAAVAKPNTTPVDISELLTRADADSTLTRLATTAPIPADDLAHRGADGTTEPVWFEDSSKTPFKFDVDLERVGRVNLELTPDTAGSGIVPLLNEGGAEIGTLRYMSWSGSDGDQALDVVAIAEDDGDWEVTSVNVIDGVNEWSWRAGENASATLEEKPVEFDIDEHVHDNFVARQYTPPTNDTRDDGAATEPAPVRSAYAPAPRYPIPAPLNEARYSDLVVVAARGVTPAQALAEAVTGRNNFNTAMDNSTHSSAPIADVGVRIIAVATVDYTKTSNAENDLFDSFDLVTHLVSATGADIAVTVFPSGWTGACGMGFSFGAIVARSSASGCNQATRYLFAHELSHVYDLYHENASSSYGYRRARVVACNGTTFRSLTASATSGLTLQYSNPNKDAIGCPGTKSGVPAGGSGGERFEAKRIHELATSIRDRRTLASAATYGWYSDLGVATRVLDTRDGLGGHSGTWSGSKQVSLVSGTMPSNAVAAVVNITAVTPSGDGYIRVNATNSFPSTLPTVVNFNAGQVIASSTIVKLGDFGTVWLNAIGSPHIVIDVIGYMSANGVSRYYPLPTPTRVCSTTDNTGGCGTTAVSAGSGKLLSIPATCASATTAVLINLTGGGTNKTGFLQAMKSNSSTYKDKWSNLNFQANAGFRANMTVTPAASGKFYVYVGGTGATSHIIVDVIGCFVNTTSGGMRYTPLTTPTRLLDTRDNNTPLVGNGSRYVTATSATSSGRVAFVNITSVNATGASFLSAYPAGQTTDTSLLNIVPGGVVANHTAVKVNSNRQFVVKRGGAAGQTHFIVDQFGYFY